MKTKSPLLLLFVTAFSCWQPLIPTARAQTPFTYQGKLENGGVPYNGTVAVRLGLCASADEAVLPIRTEVLSGVVVTNGVFTAILSTFTTADFSGGQSRWMELEISSDGATWTKLRPRQQITASPMALVAKEAQSVTGPVLASQITGSLPATQLGGLLSPAKLSGGTVSTPLHFNPSSGPSFTVGSATLIPNLNVDLLDGMDSSAFLQRAACTRRFSFA